MTEEDRQIYSHIRKLAMDGNYKELKKVEYPSIKLAYNIVGANYNLNTVKQLPRWIQLLKRVRDEMVADNALTKQATYILSIPTSE